MVRRQDNVVFYKSAADTMLKLYEIYIASHYVKSLSIHSGRMPLWHEVSHTKSILIGIIPLSNLALCTAHM